jgi:hypothetical protein
VTRSEMYAYFYSGDVPLKLGVARKLYAQFGNVLLQQPDILAHLTIVEANERALQVQMRAMTMGATCTLCASRQAGGCCSIFMAGENDVLQLLMNLLAGVQVVMQQNNQQECCFLGITGCILTMKPMFCLNYNCSHIKEKEVAVTLLHLEQRTAAMLVSQAGLEMLLLDFFCENL